MNVFPAVEGCFDSFGYHLLPSAALIDSDHPSPLTENKQVGDEYKFQARGMNTNCIIKNVWALHLEVW